MATTWWVGTAVPNEQSYFWREDVSHYMRHFKTTPQEQFAKSLGMLLKSTKFIVSADEDDGELWVHSGGVWLRISTSGEIEFGEAG